MKSLGRRRKSRWQLQSICSQKKNQCICRSLIMSCLLHVSLCKPLQSTVNIAAVISLPLTGSQRGSPPTPNPHYTRVSTHPQTYSQARQIVRNIADFCQNDPGRGFGHRATSTAVYDGGRARREPSALEPGCSDDCDQWAKRRH